MIASLVAVLLAEGIMISFSAYTQKTVLARELTSLAAVIGNNSKVILEFNLPEDARSILVNLKAKDSITAACLYDVFGHPMAVYPEDAEKTLPPAPDPPRDNFFFANRQLHVFHTVYVNKSLVGTVYLQDDMRYFYHDLRHDLFALLISLLLALAVAYAISARLQHMISGPILSLAHTAQAISEKRDYALRAPKTSEDEVGLLIDAFNDMLTTIQERDVSIRESEGKYRTLIENIPQKIFYKDVNCIYITCNENYAYDVGVPPDKITGKTDFDFFPEDLAKKYRADDRRIMQTGVTEELAEKYIQHGKEVTIQTIKTPIRDAQNRVIGLLGIFWDVTEKIKAEEQIKASLAEKEVLLKEIHHRVKNNMQVIISLLRLQAKNVSDTAYLSMLKESQNRIRSMALVHEQLYQTKDLANINIANYVTSLVASLRRSYIQQSDTVQIQTSVEGITMGLESAIPCGLIINELVSNALKYAFPNHRTGLIRIVMAKGDEGNILLEVCDNGVGLPDSIDVKITDSMGLHLVVILAEDQLKGTLEVDTTQGTCFQIRFKQYIYQPRI